MSTSTRKLEPKWYARTVSTWRSKDDDDDDDGDDDDDDGDDDDDDDDDVFLEHVSSLRVAVP